MDPTKQEIYEFLEGPECPWAEEALNDCFSEAEAIYWFAANYHGGQWTNLYEVLSQSKYKPGPLSNGPEIGSIGELLYEELVQHFIYDNE